ncbi:unnamed protein product, partial [Owenia fusiformis]
IHTVRQTGKMLVAFILLAAFTYATAQPGPGEACNPTTNQCRADSDCHPTENICYADPAQVTRPSVWLGTPPSCDARSPQRCAFSDFLFDVSHPRGDRGSQWCTSGSKARCQSRVAPALNPPTPANSIQVFSYNIFERDFGITHDGQRERTCRIPQNLVRVLPDTDAVIWQEAFMGGCWQDEANLRHLMTQHGFPYHTSTIDDPNDTFENGGVFISSRWPITAQAQIIFQNRLDFTADDFAAKGVGYAKIEKTSGGVTKPYHIFGTHMQAGGGAEGDQVRIDQAGEMRQFAVSRNIPATEAVIYGGDFNTAYQDEGDRYAEFMNALNAPQTIERIGSLMFTSDPNTNDVQRKKSPNSRPKWIDYVTHSLAHLQPTSATMEVTPTPHQQQFSVCWCELCIPLEEYVFPDDPLCTQLIDNGGLEGEVALFNHLSDHHPVTGRFTFPA